VKPEKVKKGTKVIIKDLDDQGWERVHPFSGRNFWFYQKGNKRIALDPITLDKVVWECEVECVTA
jgi:hypothetical protein